MFKRDQDWPLAPSWSIGRPHLFSTGLSWACHSIWVHCRPICRSSCSTDLLQLLFRPTTVSFTLRIPKKYLFGYVAVSVACCRSTSTSFFWFGSSSSLLGFLLVGLRCWWCSAILPRGCYVGSDLWGQGLDFCRDFLRYSPSFGSVHQDQFYICIEDPKFGPQGSWSLQISTEVSAGEMLFWLCQSSPAHLILFLHQQLSHSLGKWRRRRSLYLHYLVWLGVCLCCLCALSWSW